MPKRTSARLRANVRDHAAEHGISYSAAHAQLTGAASAAAPEAPAIADQERFPYRIVDCDNRGWLTRGDGTYSGYDPTGSLPQPFTDAQLAALAEQPERPTLTAEQVAAVVELLPLRHGITTADDLAQRLGIPAITTERIELIIDRIANEKTELPGYSKPAFDLGSRLLEPRPLHEIEHHFGPWRPVVPLTADDDSQLQTAFDLAGRKLIGTVASALDQRHFEARERFGPWDRDPNATADYAERTLTAGRAGSWESALPPTIVWFGNELNLGPAKAALTVAQRREAGPSARRVHRQARDQIAAVLRRWTSSPDRYTEVAETLAESVSFYADEQHGADGWKKIADQWLQPGGLAVGNFTNCYRLLYSKSRHFDYDLG